MGETAEARDWATQYLKSRRNVKATMDAIANITDRDRLVIGKGRCNDHHSRNCVGDALTPCQSFYAETACQEQPGVSSPICLGW